MKQFKAEYGELDYDMGWTMFGTEIIEADDITGATDIGRKHAQVIGKKLRWINEVTSSTTKGEDQK